MHILDRQQIIDRISAVERGELTQAELAAWAFDQFYAEEAGALTFEPGYRRLIATTLDDLMFADHPDASLSPTELQHLRQALAAARPQLDEDEEEDDDEEDEDAFA
ncbi:hypothetical protein [Kallotenue papyrolyticum]|uniref:hypothetical protein n=1 Tax=Kallotenue papyrolyticum TaxID=1325125 RepID=UPI000492D6E4|nr:hypothetical protein [Kallotenue papyrolyticum]